METARGLSHGLTEFVFVANSFACTKNDFRAHRNLVVRAPRNSRITVLVGKTECIPFMLCRPDESSNDSSTPSRLKSLSTPHPPTNPRNPNKTDRLIPAKELIVLPRHPLYLNQGTKRQFTILTCLLNTLPATQTESISWRLPTPQTTDSKRTTDQKYGRGGPLGIYPSNARTTTASPASE